MQFDHPYLNKTEVKPDLKKQPDGTRLELGYQSLRINIILTEGHRHVWRSVWAVINCGV